MRSNIIARRYYTCAYARRVEYNGVESFFQCMDGVDVMDRVDGVKDAIFDLW